MKFIGTHKDDKLIRRDEEDFYASETAFALVPEVVEEGQELEEDLPLCQKVSHSCISSDV